MGRCKDCCHANHDPEQPLTLIGCSCPKMMYGYNIKYDGQVLDSDCVSIEDDEGWGMIPGPEFGCVHFEEQA